jgi:hypothetical protein
MKKRNKLPPLPTLNLPTAERILSGRFTRPGRRSEDRMPIAPLLRSWRISNGTRSVTPTRGSLGGRLMWRTGCEALRTSVATAARRP